MYIAPSRETKLGDYAMILGIAVLMFIRFNRSRHFVYIRLEALLRGIFRVARIPAVSTYCRYLDSLEINQAQSILRIMSRLREQAWERGSVHLSDLLHKPTWESP